MNNKNIKEVVEQIVNAEYVKIERKESEENTNDTIMKFREMIENIKGKTYETHEELAHDVKKVTEELEELRSKLQGSALRFEYSYGVWRKRIWGVTSLIEGVAIRREHGEEIEIGIVHEDVVERLEHVIDVFDVSWLKYTGLISLSEEIVAVEMSIEKLEEYINCDKDIWGLLVKNLQDKLKTIYNIVEFRGNKDIPDCSAWCDSYLKLAEIMRDIISGERLMPQEGRGDFIEGMKAFIKSVNNEWLN